MNLDSWEDDDFETPGAGPSQEIEDDFIEFTDNLALDDLNDEAEDIPKKDLPPLPEGVMDLTNDRGVLLERKGDEGQGDKPSKECQFVEIHYEGFLVSNGERFDSSRDQNYAMIVQLDIPPSGKSSVILGLEIGLREVRKGEKVTLTIASRYAYGKDGVPDIPPDSDLRFEIEVLDVRSTHKRIVTVDSSAKDLDRLEDIRRQREIAQMRREEEESKRNEQKEKKVDRVAALREKLANKNHGKKGGKKKKK